MTILLNMGAVLSEPVTEKVSADESGENVKYGVSSMQGWRESQEDAHICLVDFDDSASLFAVLDGHGGCEVAKYCAQNLPKVLKQSKPYIEGDVVNALIKTFLQVDASLTTPEVLLKLKEIAGKEEKDDDSISDVESVGGLREEAEMPLEELMAKYKIKPVVNGKVEDKKDSNGIVNENGVVHTNGFTKPEVEEDASMDLKANVDVEMADESAFKTPTVPTRKSMGKSNPLYESLLERSYSEDEMDKSYVADSDIGDDDEEKSVKEMSGAEGEEGQLDDDGDDDDEEDEEEEEDDEWEDLDDEDDEDEMNKAGFTSGTTAIVAVLRGQDLFVANVGDSRCVVSQNGVAVEMSRDHKPTVPEEADRISKAGGSRDMAMEGRVEGDLSLSRAIGDHRYKQNKDLPPEQQMITALPDVKNLVLDPEHDFMILACDGIWDCLSSQEVVDFVRPRIMENREKLSSICEELLDRCLAPKSGTGETGWDNMTAIIVKFGPGLVSVGRKSTKRGTLVVEEEGMKCPKTESV